ncbi:zinc finger, CCHC-type containing protein [Tanacetum coccineum]|uniref:Zinc finger, CCHC-type containing protein n=1 Tax=Tanacetum coccineum TaxID=301880 RepID=A0ABQ4X3D4_9ASTR
MERFENAIFKHREEINDRMAEMFGLLKELTTSRAPEKVLIREEAKSLVTKNINSISHTRGEEEKSDKDDVATGDGIEKTNGLGTEMPVKEAETENGAKNRIKNEPIKRDEKGEGVEAPSSQPVEYYLKHRFNEKLIEGLVDNQRITRKEDIGGNFEIPCNIGGLKRMNALVDQRSNVNVMPLSTYIKLTDERPVETNIRLSLASHSYIYPLGIAEDVLVDVAGFVYPMDFVILDIKEDKKRPFILGTSFLTTTKAVIKFNKDTITLRSGKSKISFHRIHESLCKEERIKLHQEKEMKFDRWRSKNFKNEHPALVKVEKEMDDEGEVTHAFLCFNLVLIAIKGSFSKKTKRKFCLATATGKYPDGVIFDKKKLGSS